MPDLLQLRRATARLVSAETKLRLRKRRQPLRRQRRLVHDHLDIPSELLRKRPKATGSVWAVTMVRNEEDTIAFTIEHLLRQGVDRLIVADNLSTDRTPEILQALAKKWPVTVVRDRLVAYFQSTKMTMLSELAGRAGADWVVPFDADELWFAAGRAVADHLRHGSGDIVSATVHNVFPSSSDEPDDQNPFSRLRTVDTTPATHRKVAFRFHRGVILSTGNHSVAHGGSRADGLFVAHYPWRSRQQVEAKVAAGASALNAANADSFVASQWRVGAGWSGPVMEAAWLRLLRQAPVEELVWSPRGPFVIENLWDRRTWGLSE